MNCEMWCNVGKKKYWMPKHKSGSADACWLILRFLFDSNALKRFGFTVYSAVHEVGNLVSKNCVRGTKDSLSVQHRLTVILYSVYQYSTTIL